MVFYSGVLVDQIMQVCHWKAHNRFTNFYPKRPYLVTQLQQYVSGSSSSGTTNPRSFPSDQLSWERKEGRHIRCSQVFRSLNPRV